MKRTNEGHRERGNRGNRVRGHYRDASPISEEENQLESHPPQRDRPRRGRGRGLSQRGHTAQQHRDNEGRHHPEGSSGVHHQARSGRSNKKKRAQQQFLDFPFIKHDDTARLLPRFRVMFILRGLPGSGKSTVADAILQRYGNHAVICSADYHRYNEDGEYVWSCQEDELQQTYNNCRRRAEKFAALNKPVIIIDNPNETHSEVQRYTILANQYDYVAILVEPKTPWKFEAQKLAAKNTHKVSYTEICRKVEQFDEILPRYFGWFLSPGQCFAIQRTARDVLRKCLQIPEFQQCIKAFSGHSSPKFTVQNALSHYSINHSHRPELYHVTACCSPRGKNLAGSPYHKSTAVEEVLGKISQLSIIGCVVTKDTFSARVELLTKEQQNLWMDDQDRKRDVAEHSVEDMTRSFQRLPLADSARSERAGHCTHASTHITLGTRKGVNPVQSKYDVQTVVNHEASFHVFERTTSFEEYTLPGDIGTAKKLSDTMWAVYFNKARLVPAIFSGYYDDGEYDANYLHES